MILLGRRLNAVRTAPVASERAWMDYVENVPALYTGHATTTDPTVKSAKKKHPIGFAPPKAK
jgi:hypothetical protein